MECLLSTGPTPSSLLGVRKMIYDTYLTLNLIKLIREAVPLPPIFLPSFFPLPPSLPPPTSALKGGTRVPKYVQNSVFGNLLVLAR